MNSYISGTVANNGSLAMFQHPLQKKLLNKPVQLFPRSSTAFAGGVVNVSQSGTNISNIPLKKHC
jgi:hypothetical protein